MQRIISSIAPYFLPLLLPVLPFVGIMTPGGETFWGGIFSAATVGIACILTGLVVIFGFRSGRGLFSMAALLGVPLLVAGTVSAVSTESSITLAGFLGQGFEFGSWGSLALITLTIALCVYATRGVAPAFLATISLVSVLVSLCAILLWFGVSLFVPLTTLAPLASFFLCAASITAAVLFDSGRRYRVAYASASALSFIGFFVFFNPWAAYVGIGVVLVNIVYSLHPEEGPSLTTFPFATAVVGTALSLSNVFGFTAPQVVVPLDIRPSLTATEYITGPEYLFSFRTTLLGTGPGSLSYAWNLYRPVEFNADSRWYVTPDSTFSTATTLAIEVGILGFFGFLLLPLVVLFKSVSVSSPSAGVLKALRSLALFLFGSALFYSIDLSLLLIGVAAVGLSFSEEYAEPYVEPLSRGRRRVLLLVAAVVMCVGFSLTLVASLQGSGAYYATRGQVVLDEGNPDDASILFDKAVAVWPAASYLRGTSISYARKLFGRLESGVIVSDAVAARADADKAVAFAKRATNADDRDYALWLYKGSLYTALVQMEYPDASESARMSLNRAQTLAPNRPDIPYMQALLNIALGNSQLAREDIQKALNLKPNYKDALDLLQSLR